MMGSSVNWFEYAPPEAFFPLAGRLAPWFAVLAAILLVGGMYIGFVAAPFEAQWRGVNRIIFIHGPAVWMSIFIYLVMTFWAAAGYALNTRLSGMMASALAPTGALFTLLALWTGLLWGKPAWGSWWAWDAHLTIELILLFLYFGFMVLHAVVNDHRRADRSAAVLALVGVVTLPIIYFALRWWNTLHQGVSDNLKSAPSMAMSMFAGMIVMMLACWMYSIAASLWRVRCVILERERNTEWVANYARTLQ